ncbi:wax ester/triacylglycerol synthase family O-acyltransferase [Streptosporangiaceae bacterium NEAU-GS5]|nr:wax ester/triacylglycerol synthase family O-acyltransferase [Streptosporangiaceae bacterium NEAU-GS5]
MRRLLPLDAEFLNLEDATTVTNIGGLAVLDGAITLEDLRDVLRRRLPEQLRARLLPVPLGLPYWIEDGSLELDYHVREIALPAPGDDGQLAGQVARIHERPLDRRRPLWEMYLIQGLAGGRSAVYMKMSHAVADGIGGADVMAALMDFTPEPADRQPVHQVAEGAPSRLDLLGQGIRDIVSGLPNVIPAVERLLAQLDTIPIVSRLPFAGRFRGEQPPVPRLVPPHTILNRPVGPHRGFAFCSLSFDQVKQAKARFGVTVNDVVLALCAGAVRRWLLDRDALPVGPLVAGVPVAQPVRAGGNRLTLMMAAFPTHLDDPADRVGATAESMAAVKARAAESSWVDDVTGLLPPALAAPLTRAAFWLAARTVTPLNLIISNVPGPQVPLYVCGARLIAHYPVSVVTDVSGAVNITVFSYDGALHVGVIASRDLDLDLWDLTGHIEAELGTLTG